MPEAEIVRIALDADPGFPKNCVVCRAPWPDHTVALSRRREGFFNAFGMLPLGRRHSFAVPACPPCAEQLNRRYRIDTLLTVLGGVVAAAIALAAGRIWQISALWTFLGAVAVFSMAIAARQFLTPPAFDFSVESDHIEFAFASAEYAMVFRTQNEMFAASRTVGRDMERR